LENIENNKRRIARWYDKKVKAKEFAEGDLVWKLILPISSRDPKYGKWSPSWEGPYRNSQCVPGNAYILETLEGEKFARALKGKYLKKYYPSKWVGALSNQSLKAANLRLKLQPIVDEIVSSS
jgi:hypothetical protein